MDEQRVLQLCREIYEGYDKLYQLKDQDNWQEAADNFESGGDKEELRAIYTETKELTESINAKVRELGRHIDPRKAIEEDAESRRKQFEVVDNG